MGKLYEIANDYAKLMDDENLTPDMIADTLDGMEGEFNDKVEQLLALIKEESYTIDALKSEAKKMTDRAKAIENKINGFKQYIITSMNTMDKKKISTGIHALTVKDGVPKCEIVSADDLPIDYVNFETTSKPDMKYILQDLKLGRDIPGAKLVTGKQSLLIK